MTVWRRFRRIRHLFHSGHPGACWRCLTPEVQAKSRAVWAQMEGEPGFNEHLRQAREDMEAGRWYSWENDISTPNPDWPKDGPQPHPPRALGSRKQPKGTEQPSGSLAPGGTA